MRRVLIAIALLLVPTLALAQAETTGRVTGTVLDEDRRPVAGAELTLESPALQGQRRTAADANGRYLASLLPPGVYTMTVNAPGKTPLQYTFRVGIGQTIPIDAVLKSGADLVEDITVFSPAAELETTAGGENFNYETTINQLPITNRTLEGVAALAPNVSFGPTPNTVSIGGAPSFDTVVLLDGAEISDPYFGSGTVVYLEESIEETQVLTSGVSAKYGRFQGGVINAITKSGGNTFDGTFRLDLANESWNAKTPYPFEQQSDDLQKVYSATLGGPIVKDRLWFYLGGRTIPTFETTTSTLSTGTRETFVTATDQDRWQAKLTGSFTANHTIDVGYLEFDGTSAGRAGLPAADLRAASGARIDPREIWTAEYTGIFSDRTFLNVQGTKKDVSIASGGDPALGTPILEFYSTSRFQIWGNHWWDFNDPSVRNNETLSAAMTNVLTAGDWGDHTLEYGLQWVNSITAGDNRQSSTGYNLTNYDIFLGGRLFPTCDSAEGPCGPPFTIANLFTDGGLSYRWVALPGVGEQEITSLAAFVQDSWQLGKWRFDLGLRWENWKGNAISPAMTLDFDDISPRVGVTYNITPDWQIQGAYGKYVSRFNDGVASNVTGVSGAPFIVQLYTCDTATGLTYEDVTAIVTDDDCWQITTFVNDPTQPTSFLRDNVSAPYATDINLSVKRALPRNTGSVTVTYSQREFSDLIDNFVGDEGQTTIVDPQGSGLEQDYDTTVWDNCGLCRRDYQAVSTTFEYRPSAKWDLGGNYTWSRNRGNYEGEGRNTPASGSIIGNYPRVIDQSAAFPYGYTDEDVRHRGRVWGQYRFDFGRAGNLNFGGLFSYRSGNNWNRSAGVATGTPPPDEYLSPPRTYTKFFDGRGNNRFSGYWNLDMSVKYQISAWRDLGIYVKGDVLNVTNEDTLKEFNTAGRSVVQNGVQTWVPLDSFGQVRNEDDYQPARTYNLSVGLVW